MLRVPVNQIEPGMTLARPIPVPSDPRRFMLQRGREIPMDLVPQLKQLGIVEVWVQYHGLEFLEEIVDEGVSDCLRDMYACVRANFEELASNPATPLDITRLQNSISGLVDYLRYQSPQPILYGKLDAFDNYLVSHSVNVCYLGLLLGMRLERYVVDQQALAKGSEELDPATLGMGCLLHDIGKLRVSQEILDKPEELTPAEHETVRRHPAFGYEMVKSRVPAAAAQIVLGHHQMFNGCDYPGWIDERTGESLPPLEGTQIPIFSRIASVADVYDAATTARCYSSAKQPAQVLHEMQTHDLDRFDPVVAKAFYEIAPPFPLGQVVELSNGIEAVVADFNPTHPLRPKVLGLREPNGKRFSVPSLQGIDLLEHEDLEIAFVNGEDVRPYQVSLPTSASDYIGSLIA